MVSQIIQTRYAFTTFGTCKIRTIILGISLILKMQHFMILIIA